MSGRFTVLPAPGDTPAGSRPQGAEKIGSFVQDTGTDPTHDHVVFEMEGGATVTYNDPRRFGFMDLVAADGLDACKHFQAWGRSRWETGSTLAISPARAQGRAADLKAFLLDQRNIAGLGNIYVCEALFRTGLSPNRAASCLADRKGRPTSGRNDWCR